MTGGAFGSSQNAPFDDAHSALPEPVQQAAGCEAIKPLFQSAIADVQRRCRDRLRATAGCLVTATCSVIIGWWLAQSLPQSSTRARCRSRAEA